MTQHSVEKIGGTSMSRSDELLETIFKGNGKGPYGRIFVVSAYGGITNLLLEDKKSGAPGVYGLFAAADGNHAWLEALDRVAGAMRAESDRLLSEPADRREAEHFLRERIEGARTCLIDLQRLCSYGHFRLDEQMATIRELLSGLGEAHSAHTTTVLLRRHGINARFVDLSGWRDDRVVGLEERLAEGFRDVDLATELPIVTGYAQCSEGLMREYDRGYSEVTFARIAALTAASEAVIHKEFHLSSADPKTVGADAVRKIGRTNYDVADQLSNMGMEAIHPGAARILRQAGIPLRIANAFEPEDPGTLIDSHAPEAARVEMVTGLDVTALEVFEQDMLGVKGYDAAILDALTRHRLRIVSKSSNANTITHFVDASLKAVRRAERQIAEAYPGAQIGTRRVALVAAIGRDIGGLDVMRRGLEALAEAGIVPLALQQGSRAVDAQFVVPAEDQLEAVRALHRALVEETGRAGAKAAAPGVPHLVRAA